MKIRFDNLDETFGKVQLYRNCEKLKLSYEFLSV